MKQTELFSQIHRYIHTIWQQPENHRICIQQMRTIWHVKELRYFYLNRVLGVSCIKSKCNAETVTRLTPSIHTMASQIAQVILDEKVDGVISNEYAGNHFCQMVRDLIKNDSLLTVVPLDQ